MRHAARIRCKTPLKKEEAQGAKTALFSDKIRTGMTRKVDGTADVLLPLFSKEGRGEIFGRRLALHNVNPHLKIGRENGEKVE